MTSASSQAAVGALTSANIVAMVIPAAWPCAALMYANQGDPEAVFKAGLKWLDMYGEFGGAQEAADGTELPKEEWQGRDRDAYDERIDEYRGQLTGSKQLAFAVGTTMTMIGGLLLIVVALMVVIAVILLACLAYVLAALAGVFTAPAAYAQASEVAVECETFLEQVSTVVAKVAAACAGVVAAVMALDVGWQKAFHNDAVFADLGGSFRDAADNMVWGTLAKLEQMVMSAGMKTNAPATDPTGRVPNSWVWRQSRHGKSPVSGGFGLAGLLQGAGGANFTETIQKMVPDYNKRDKGLFDDPPKED
jgi:hypothetical protein